MVNPNRFYTYAYLREDKTPYYIGKGQGDRAYNKYRNVKPPKDISRIIVLKENLTEEEAFHHEIYIIDIFGRKDLGTGILINKTDGGEGTSGVVRNEEWRRKLRESNKGQIRTEESKRKMSDAKKGENGYWYGKSLTEEHKINLSKAHKGKIVSEETKRKLREVKKDVKWWNDKCGNTKLCVECPGGGWILGRGTIPRKPKVLI